MYVHALIQTGEDTPEDPKLAEFLALMAPRRRAKLWANDDLLPQQTLQDLQVWVLCVCSACCACALCGEFVGVVRAVHACYKLGVCLCIYVCLCLCVHAFVCVHTFVCVQDLAIKLDATYQCLPST
jgi:hypothetical protein